MISNEAGDECDNERDDNADREGSPHRHGPSRGSDCKDPGTDSKEEDNEGRDGIDDLDDQEFYPIDEELPPVLRFRGRLLPPVDLRLVAHDEREDDACDDEEDPPPPLPPDRVLCILERIVQYSANIHILTVPGFFLLLYINISLKSFHKRQKKEKVPEKFLYVFFFRRRRVSAGSGARL